MSKNKLSKFAEVHALPNVVEVPYAELLQGPYKLQGKWGSQFFGNDFPVVLELGCGKGEYTVGLAENFPDPQMKKGRKRLTSTKLLAHYCKVMKPGGIVHLKTDSNFLYQYTSALVNLNGFKVEDETDDLY